MVVTTALDTDTPINAVPNLSQKKFDYSEQWTKFTLMSAAARTNVPTACNFSVATLINKYDDIIMGGLSSTNIFQVVNRKPAEAVSGIVFNTSYLCD